MRPQLLLFPLLACVACGTDPGPTVDSAAPARTGDASPIQIAATNGTLDLPFSASMNAKGTFSVIGAISLPQGVGTVDVSGIALPTFVYTTAPGFEPGESIVIALGLD